MSEVAFIDFLENHMSEQDHRLIEEFIRQLQTTTNDHEQRLRFLERTVSLTIGGLTVVYWVVQQLAR